MTQAMTVTFPGGKRVDAEYAGHVIRTDQPAPGGEGTAPDPFTLFLASLATCAGYYVLAFCQARSIPLEGVRLVQRHAYDPETRLLSSVDLDLELPPDFPPTHVAAVRQAALSCKVKKTLAAPPPIELHATVRA